MEIMLTEGIDLDGFIKIIINVDRDSILDDK